MWMLSGVAWRSARNESTASAAIAPTRLGVHAGALGGGRRGLSASEAAASRAARQRRVRPPAKDEAKSPAADEGVIGAAEP